MALSQFLTEDFQRGILFLDYKYTIMEALEDVQSYCKISDHDTA